MVMQPETHASFETAADLIGQVSLELVAASALLGARERTRTSHDSPHAEALVLTSREAYGFALMLDLIAGQLRQAEDELRAALLAQAG